MGRRKKIADMTEINEFWTKIVRGEEKDLEKPVPLRDKIKASELIAKTEGAFSQKSDNSDIESLEVVIDYGD